MGIAQDRRDITDIIVRSANLYKSNLIGKTFLYCFDGRFLEVVFRASDFLHMTGVETRLSAHSFYVEAVRGHLRANQISFSQRHPYELCEMKVVYLEQLCRLTTSDVLIHEDLTTDTSTYKFGVSDLAFTVCLERCQTLLGNPYFFIKSLRAGDGINRSRDTYEVDCTLCRNTDCPYFTSVPYIDARYKLNMLPASVISRLSPELKELATAVMPK